MKRRNFFTSLIAMPVLAVAGLSMAKEAKSSITTQIPTLCRDCQPLDPFQIMSPYDIGDAGFVFVDTPTFEAYGKIYCMRTWILKSISPGIPDKHIIYRTRLRATRDITRLGLTHIHSVRFNPYPVIHPDGTPMYKAYVRGATVKY